MKRLCLIIVAAIIPLFDASAAVPPASGDGNHPPAESAKNLENDQVFFVQGQMTFPPPIGTISVDLKVTTCKQGTSGCKP